MRLLSRTALACTALLAVSCSTQKSFKMALLPDTQTYACDYPEIFHAQTRWLAEHRKEIAFVLHLGDITNNNSEKQWEVAAAAMNRLDGKVPYVLTVGNHDLGEKGRTGTRDSRLFNRYFPYEKYSLDKHFGGAFEPGKMENVWYTFRAGRTDWLVLSLEFGPRDKVLEWAGEVIRSHPDKNVIIDTHAYLYSDDTRMQKGHRWLPQHYGAGKNATGGEAANNGEQMWQKLIAKYPNIVFVFSGHVLNDGTGLLVSEGAGGNRVCQILSNYQRGVNGSKNGGDGFLRIVSVDTAAGTVSVQSYSPYTNTYKTEPDHQFTVKGLKFR